MSTLKSFPPLVPVPSTSASTPRNDTDDIFSTLFSPATPPASPRLSASASPAPAPAPSRRATHARSWSNASANSDFGAFVSVSASDDPLNSPQPADDDFADFATPTSKPFTPLKTEFFDRFTEDARRANEKNKSVLTELLEHEDDPLYFLAAGGNHAASPSGASTPVRPPTPQHIIEEPLLDLSTADPAPRRISHSPSRSYPTHLSRTANATSPEIPPSRGPPSPLVRSPSVPPSPTRPTPPILTRTQSQTTFAPSTRPTRWMSSFLSSVAPPAPSPAPTYAPPHPTPVSIHPPPHAPLHIASLPPDISHGSPFAAHPYIPPSGAPGFAGDRSWNVKGLEFDSEAAERRGVQLLGRKEMTVAVLSERLAGELRPHLPALARLPKAWDLLYSLDQHGISLQTLYARCESHPGGALVAVRDANDAVFGAWMGEGVRMSRGAYFGSGESFLWKMNDKLHVYKWTGKNDYVALCEPGYISFGGGDGHYGLYLDDTLFDGSSARCPTFDNEPLCSPGPKKGGTVTFECVGLEVWGVGGL